MSLPIPGITSVPAASVSTIIVRISGSWGCVTGLTHTRPTTSGCCSPVHNVERPAHAEPGDDDLAGPFREAARPPRPRRSSRPIASAACPRSSCHGPATAGSSTWKPAPATAWASPRIDDGLPVKPWSTSTPAASAFGRCATRPRHRPSRSGAARSCGRVSSSGGRRPARLDRRVKVEWTARAVTRDGRPGISRSAAARHGARPRAQAAAARRGGRAVHGQRLRGDAHRGHLPPGRRRQGPLLLVLPDQAGAVLRARAHDAPAAAPGPGDGDGPHGRRADAHPPGHRGQRPLPRRAHRRYFALLDVERADAAHAELLREGSDVYRRDVVTLVRAGQRRGPSATRIPSCSPSACSAPSPRSPTPGATAASTSTPTPWRSPSAPG